jgi:hypothetical protein
MNSGQGRLNPTLLELIEESLALITEDIEVLSHKEEDVCITHYKYGGIKYISKNLAIAAHIKSRALDYLSKA